MHVLPLHPLRVTTAADDVNDSAPETINTLIIRVTLNEDPGQNSSSPVRQQQEHD